MDVKYPLVLLLLIPIAIFVYYLRKTSKTHNIEFPKVAFMKDLESKRAVNLLRLTNGLEILILCLLVVTIAQPQFIKSKQFQTKKGIDIVAILDTSGSMNAEDFKPKNRMTVAKETLERFLKKRSSDRVGLVIFGTDAITKAPITYDQRIINYHISQTKVGEAGEGTAIGLAIATGVNRLAHSKTKSKILILITDGVNNAGQIDPISAAKLAKNKGIKIYCIGIGDKKGAPIPIYHPTYGKRYARHPNGRLVVTEFDDSTLKQIATITNAVYFNAKNTEELKNVFKKIDQLEKTVIKTTRNYIVFDLFPYFIGFIMVLVLIKEAIILKSLIGVRT